MGCPGRIPQWINRILENPLPTGSSSAEDSTDCTNCEEEYLQQVCEWESHDQQEELELDGLDLDNIFKEYPNLDMSDEEELERPKLEQPSSYKSNIILFVIITPLTICTQDCPKSHSWGESDWIL